jgi:hypothetical protein
VRHSLGTRRWQAKIQISDTGFSLLQAYWGLLPDRQLEKSDGMTQLETAV